MINTIANQILIAKNETDPEKKIIQLKTVRRKLIEIIIAKDTSNEEKNKAFKIIENDLLLFMN
jgi:hypothetical protein